MVGDNIDHEIRVRVQTKDRSNQSIHWTYQYAIKDSVINPLLDNKAQKSLDQLQLMDFLPTPEVQARLKKTWAIFVSRVVTTHLNEFQSLQSIVIKYIPHPFSAEASKKSEMVSTWMSHNIKLDCNKLYFMVNILHDTTNQKFAINRVMIKG